MGKNLVVGQPRLLARARHERARRERLGHRQPRDRDAEARQADLPRRHHLRRDPGARQEGDVRRQAGHRDRRDQGHQPARRRGLLLQAQGDGVEAGRSRRPAGRPYDDARTIGPTDPEREPGTVAGRRSRSTRAAAEGFERGAGDYERARPSYPADAVGLRRRTRSRCGPGTRVLDLAAGTGKLTRLLVPSGADVVAVEPVAAMRAELVAAVPGVEVLDGTAEAIPLADALGRRRHRRPGVPLVRPPRGPRPRCVGCCDRTARSRWSGTCATRRSTGCAQFTEIMVDGVGRHALRRTTTSTTAGGGRRSARWRSPPRPSAVDRYDQTVDDDLLVARAASTSFVVGAARGRARRGARPRSATWSRTHPELAGRRHVRVPVTTPTSSGAAAGLTRRAAARRCSRGASGNRRDLPWRRTRDPWAVLVSRADAAADPGGRVVPALRRVPRALPHAAGLRGGDARRRRHRVGGPRLQPPGRQPPPGAVRRRRRPRRVAARRPRRSARAAGHRSLHGARACWPSPSSATSACVDTNVARVLARSAGAR